MNEVNNERKVNSRIKHKNIINMKAAWGEKEYLYLLFDYALNGDLSTFIRQNIVLEFSVA